MDPGHLRYRCKIKKIKSAAIGPNGRQQMVSVSDMYGRESNPTSKKGLSRMRIVDMRSEEKRREGSVKTREGDIASRGRKRDLLHDRTLCRWPHAGGDFTEKENKKKKN